MIDYMICWNAKCEKLVFLGKEEDIPNVPPPEKRACGFLYDEADRSADELAKTDHKVPDDCLRSELHSD